MNLVTLHWYICHIYTSIQSHVLEGCPSLCHLEFTFCHFTFAERVMTAPSADVSLLLTLRAHSVDTDADSPRGPGAVQHTSSICGLSFEVQLSSSFGATKSSVWERERIHNKYCAAQNRTRKLLNSVRKVQCCYVISYMSFYLSSMT